LLQNCGVLKYRLQRTGVEFLAFGLQSVLEKQLFSKNTQLCSIGSFLFIVGRVLFKKV